MKMLRWMFGAGRHDRIRNGRIRGTVKVGTIWRKIHESRLSGLSSCREGTRIIFGRERRRWKLVEGRREVA